MGVTFDYLKIELNADCLNKIDLEFEVLGNREFLRLLVICCF